MHSLNIEYLKSLRLNTQHASTLQKIGEFKGRQTLYFKQQRETLEALQQVAIIESNTSSNRLEGITAPRKRIEAIVLKSTNPRNRPEQEIAGYRDALSLIHDTKQHLNDSFAQHMQFSVNIILQLHRMLYRHMPQEGGRWKSGDNRIVEKNPDGTISRVRFEAVKRIETPQAMENLVQRYSDAIRVYRVEPLIVIPAAVFDFLCIHPFDDGNGRMSRLLTLMLLYHFDYQVGRYISLERIFEQSKQSYYETLELSSAGWHEGRHDIFPWMTYFWGVLLAAYNDFEDRVGNLSISGKGSKTERIHQAIERKLGAFSISDLEAELPDISRDMLRVVLRQLRDEGLLETTGRGPTAKWIKVKND